MSVSLSRHNYRHLLLFKLSNMAAKKRTRAVTAVVNSAVPIAEDATNIPIERRVSGRLRERKQSIFVAEDVQLLDEAMEDATPPPKRQRRSKKNNEPIVYDISPVEQKTTSWRGTC
jgi:hypothetical protein